MRVYRRYRYNEARRALFYADSPSLPSFLAPSSDVSASFGSFASFDTSSSVSGSYPHAFRSLTVSASSFSSRSRVERSV